MLSKLTEQAAERFAAMGDGVEEAQRRVLAIQRRIGDTERQMRLKNPDVQSEDFVALEKELNRQRAQLTGGQATFLELSRVHTAVRTWIAQLPSSARLEDTEVGFGEPKSGEDFTEAVVRVRCEIEDLASARSAIKRALLPVEELCAAAEAHVDSIAARGRPSLRHDGINLAARHGIDGPGAQATAFLVWLFADQTKERLRREIEVQRERDMRAELLVLSAAERAQRLGSIDKLILAKEQQEEWLIRDAEQQGTIIPRREKASPLAILGLRVAPRRRTAPQQEVATQAR